jgi:hypothetical protein
MKRNEFGVIRWSVFFVLFLFSCSDNDDYILDKVVWVNKNPSVDAGLYLELYFIEETYILYQWDGMYFKNKIKTDQGTYSGDATEIRLINTKNQMAVGRYGNTNPPTLIFDSGSGLGNIFYPSGQRPEWWGW